MIYFKESYERHSSRMSETFIKVIKIKYTAVGYKDGKEIWSTTGEFPIHGFLYHLSRKLHDGELSGDVNCISILTEDAAGEATIVNLLTEV